MNFLKFQIPNLETSWNEPISKEIVCWPQWNLEAQKQQVKYKTPIWDFLMNLLNFRVLGKISIYGE